MRLLHERYSLYSERYDTYTFVPEGTAQSLTVNRSTGDITINPPTHAIPSSATRSDKVVYGILGLISLSLSDYLIVLTGRTLLARFMGHDIYRATDFEILPLQNVSTYLPPHPVEAHLLALVRSHLNTGNFLFSYTWDLTRRLQAQWQSRDGDAGKPFWEVVDDRFFWNRFLQTKFIETATANIDSPLGSFILPIMYGTFELKSAVVQGRHIQIGLVSRRSRFRAGARFFRRGLDHDGQVANFNETEQILLVEEPGASAGTYATRLSFVQIRGSIPLFWSEINNLRYTPDLSIMELDDTKSSMSKHLIAQNKTYGHLSLVNLVNQKGREKPMKETYERYVEELDLPDVKYQYFDFHGECKHMRWDRIGVLIDKMQNDLEIHSYFRIDSDALQPSKLQSGIVRTNCMDNLDRTNVVQASLAKHTLTIQLRELGIISPMEDIDKFESLSKDFREMWADHADAISNAYAGSGALKSDFTRTNERTRKGVLDDGVKSFSRYLKNNFFDGARQDGFDLITGTWVSRKNPSSSLFLIGDARPLIIRSMPPLASFSLFMVCAGLTLPRTSDYSLFYYFMLWFTLLALALVFMLIHGIDYVSWPRLNPLTDAIYYNGPGYRTGHRGKGFGSTRSTLPSWKTKILPSNMKRVHRVAVDEVELGTLKKRVD